MSEPPKDDPNWDKFFEQLWKISEQIEDIKVRIKRLTDPLEGLGHSGKKDEEEDKGDAVLRCTRTPDVG